ncbi:MAG: amino acid permease [Betaproteobacteria bacterium]|nr:amino acid permease [Betaproteobacteria bacterium]
MESDPATMTSAPKQQLSVSDGIFLTVGMVIGVGIFKAPSIVASNTSGGIEFLLVWLLGGVVSLCGALVYAELSSRYPETGGEYTFIAQGLGRGAAFLFAWSRMTVIQTGAIAAVAFVFGEYASEIVRLGEHSVALYAVLSVIALTLLNLAGTLQSKTLQKVMEMVLITGLLFLAIAGLLVGGAPVQPRSVAPAGAGGDFLFAMMFVFFTFGGWNEAAYLAGEVREPRRNMLKILLGGILIVTVLYLLVNIGYLVALGQGGVAGSKAVGVDLMRLVAGDKGALLLAFIVCISALTTINAAVFTGARSNFAMGRDYPLFAKLGDWRESGSTPANALILQGAITLVLVVAAAITAKDGFDAMVAYTAPVFWTFFLLTGLVLFVFRMRDKSAGAPKNGFKVPFYPVIPLIFCTMCGFMLWKALAYIFNPAYGPKFGNLVLAGLLVMLAGIPLYWFARKK